MASHERQAKNVKKKKLIPDGRFELASPGRELNGCLR